MAELRERFAVESEQIEATLALLPQTQALASLSPLECAGVASLLHNFYNGIENIIKQIFQAHGIAMPTGYSWHRELLDSAGEHGVLCRDTVTRLAPYLAFRHYFVHGYLVRIEAARLVPLIEPVHQLYRQVSQELMAYLSRR